MAEKMNRIALEVEGIMIIKEEIHALSEEMVENLGRLVAIDSQLGTPAEGMPFGEGPAKALKEGLQIAKELTAKLIECRTVSVGNVTEVFPRIYRCVYKTITDETGQKESAGE